MSIRDRFDIPDDGGDFWTPVDEIGADEHGDFVIETTSGTLYRVARSDDHDFLIRWPEVETIWISQRTGQPAWIDKRPLPIAAVVELRVGERGRVKVDTGEIGRRAETLTTTPIIKILKSIPA